MPAFDQTKNDILPGCTQGTSEDHLWNFVNPAKLTISFFESF